MDRGAWWATVHNVAELDMTEHHIKIKKGKIVILSKCNYYLIAF